MTDQTQSLIEYLVSQPLEAIQSLLTQAQTQPDSVAQSLENEGVQPVAHDGKTTDLRAWFNEHSGALAELNEALGNLIDAAEALPEEDRAIVRRVVEMQTHHEAFYGMANLYAVIDAQREAGHKDGSKPEASTTAFRLQMLYDKMPEDLKGQTREYLKQNYTMQPA